MNLSWRDWPVVVKLTLTTTVLVVATVIGVTLLSMRREREAFRSELEQQAEIMLSSLSVTAAMPLYFLQVDTLTELSKGLYEVENVVLIAFYDPEGRPLAGRNREGDKMAAYTIDPVGKRLIESEGTLFTWRSDVLEAGAALTAGGQRLGAAMVGLSTAPLESKMAAVRNQGLGVALLALVVGTVLAVLNTRSMVRPLAQLVEATKRIAGGDLKYRIEMRGRDEFAVLAAAFADMTLRLQEQTAELQAAHETLLRKQRLATLGELAGSIGHEIRNPLGAMSTSIYFLRMTQKLVDEKALEHLGRIERQIDRCNRIITELLDYARNPSLEAERFVLQEAVGKALTELKVPDTVSVDRPREIRPVVVEADPGQIERILMNLFRNGVQAMAGEGTLRVDCLRRNDEAIVTVTDTGVGIAPENFSKVFEPLYTSKTKGIGLGLAVSQRYAQLNGGRIECESELGKGATFRLVLPALEDEAASSSSWST